MTAYHAACRFSATIRTDDIAVLHMLRGLCQHCESGTYKQIAWGGTGADDWRRNGKEVTFRFTDPADRDGFLSHAGRLLPGVWVLAATDNNDPATPRR
jgi:hypothetical protein